MKLIKKNNKSKFHLALTLVAGVILIVAGTFTFSNLIQTARTLFIAPLSTVFVFTMIFVRDITSHRFIYVYIKDKEI
jgi:hypothetical protein